MCAACVAQGITYVGGAVGTLRLMAARAEHNRRQRTEGSDRAEPVDETLSTSA
jgi:hypothetical protein